MKRVWNARRVQDRCARLLGALAQRNASDRSRTPSLTKAFSDYEQKKRSSFAEVRIDVSHLEPKT
jgi:hypothetical protein